MTGTALALPNPSLFLSGPVGSLEAYVERVSGIPMLGRDEEFALARRFRNPFPELDLIGRPRGDGVDRILRRGDANLHGVSLFVQNCIALRVSLPSPISRQPIRQINPGAGA